MSEPTDEDVDMQGRTAHATFAAKKRESHSEWAYAPLDDVKRNIASVSSYSRVRLVKGKCEETLRDEGNLPERISVLRLDTDWYESTRAELDILYPRLSRGGILIVDDYGHWGGSRKAVDEYFAVAPVYMARIDYTARLIVKL